MHLGPHLPSSHSSCCHCCVVVVFSPVHTTGPSNTTYSSIFKLVFNFFNGKDPRTSRASTLMRLSPMVPVCKPHQHFEKTQDLLLDIAPFPLCIESAGGIMTALLSSLTLLPPKNLHTGCSYTNIGKTECLNQGQQLPRYI